MKKITALLLFSLIFLACNTTTKENVSEIKETPHDFMFMQRAYPTGEIRTDARRLAAQWKRDKMVDRLAGTPWELVGPINTGGRVTDIEIPIDQAQTYYVGSASGGIFKTTDAGSSWFPIFDDQEMLSIGDIEISKNNTNVVWVGTGEVNAGGGSLAYDGDGVYRSTDAGLTWESRGLPNVGSIGKVLIDPNDENTIFVGAMGPLFRDDTNRGVYRTTDGGANWDQVFFVSDITGVIDMANHPTDSDVIYAATWERVRRPEMRDYGGATSGLHRSIDGGTTWNELTNGLPSNPALKGRISIDISQSNPSVLYARYADATGSIQGVYRTADGGDTWTAMNAGGLTNVGFHWWFRGIFVDPTDENTIYNVDFVVEKSTDGGSTWGPAFENAHVDQHALAFNASVSGQVLLGNDGGLYVSNDSGATFTKDETLPITQFYRVYVDPNNSDKIYGGTQDNNTIRTQTDGSNDWQSIYGGDGFQPLVEDGNTDVIYALSQRGNLGKSINNGASFGGALNGIASGDRNNWDTPIAFNPNNSQTLYYGTQRLYKTTDGAANWTAISNDLTNGSGGGNLTFGTITSIDVSSFDSDLIYVGTDDSNVWVTQDGGTIWNNISGTLPNRWTTRVQTSIFNEGTVYVTFSGYRYGEDQGNIFESTDFGTTWTDISGDLPDGPINDVEESPSEGLFVATDFGVMHYTGSSSWEVWGPNLPNVVITDIHYDEASAYLYAGTYGRSMYRSDVGVLGANEVLEKEIAVFPNPATDIVNIQLNDGSAITVEVYDANGRKVDVPVSKTQNTTIDVATLATGAYYLKVVQGNRTATKKLLVK